MITTFTLAFIQAHQDAFDEYLALGVLASQRNVEGKESPEQYARALRLQALLKARRSLGLTAKEEEALDGCLALLSELQVTPTIIPFVTEGGFLVYVEGGRIPYVEGGFIRSVV